eukprot:CAMPEP_0118680348 /NCGR_PEP_ID=MMETSP0800-20121206/4313_1 /TAXON_ID=210618 ORGANISM="Striatella unipunctata, Strain CCMP2910" /NCGR_SAMPLE_ID=MMETSP0800 /ASSEMBLY_ACC=CAM_ASM_000638 /LENGTH=142 /DNA_ID=CAMNT_0006576483 /DNA_START=107 /DNA_END=536 /DNA_ORIENTATION=-
MPAMRKMVQGRKGPLVASAKGNGSEHSQATSKAAMERTVFALVKYNPNSIILDTPKDGTCKDSRPLSDTESVFQLIREGNLDGLFQAIENGFNPRDVVDRRGAQALLYAAGGGHLELVKYLVESCNCSPHEGQQGKRSFCGR